MLIQKIRRLIYRELTLWKLRREIDRKRKIWLSVRLLQKHPDEWVRHRKSSEAVLDYMHAVDTYTEAKGRALDGEKVEA